MSDTDKKELPKKRHIIRNLFILLIILTVCGIVAWGIYPYAAAGPERETPAISVNKHAELKADPENRLLKIITMNLAHGRKRGPYQLFQSKGDIQTNLAFAAEVLRREQAFVVALQEADGPSLWSGGFDHVAWLSELAGYPYFCRSSHVGGLKHDYGTALLSLVSPFDPASIRFPVTAFHPPKGFTVSTFIPPWQGADPIDIASVHLDHLSESERKKQAAELAVFFADRNQPRIVMGDFNSGWNDEETLVLLCTVLKLRAYASESKELGTFASSGRRLDWILISDNMEFVSYKVLQDEVSDHFAVCADIIIDKR